MLQGAGSLASPEKMLSQIGLKEGITVADFGCGHGFFTIPAGKIIGKEGKIYAIDVLAECLEAVHSRARLEGIVNILTTRGNLEVPGGSGIKDGVADLVLLHNVLFQSQKKADILKEVVRVLKLNGSLVVIDWLPAPDATSAFGPQGGWRLSVEEAKKIAQEEGLAFNRSLDAGEYQYGLVFIKS